MVKGTENRIAMHTSSPSPPFPPPWLRPSLSSVHPLSSFLLSLYHPHLSAQKVSKCQMGVVIIFNGVIFLHRNTVYLPARVCVCVCVRGSRREYNWTEWNRTGYWKWEITACNKGRTHTHTYTHMQTHICMHRERLEIELRMHSTCFILLVVFPCRSLFVMSCKETTKLQWATSLRRSWLQLIQ